MRILLLGFEPFGGGTSNTGWDVISALARDGLVASDGAAIDLHSARLPVAFGGLSDRIDSLLAEVNPAVAVGIGLAAGRPRVTVERIAINLADAQIPDNSGHQPRNLALAPAGPAAYWSTVDVPGAVVAAQDRGCDVAESLSAGAYVCNATLYHLADRTTRAAAEFAPRTGVGFIHVPAATPDAVADHDPVRSDVPLVPLPTIVTAVKAVLSAWV